MTPKLRLTALAAALASAAILSLPAPASAADEHKQEQGAATRQGAGKVVAALNEYGRYFDHPGWKRF